MRRKERSGLLTDSFTIEGREMSEYLVMELFYVVQCGPQTVFGQFLLVSLIHLKVLLTTIW
jgi:hypothetical protein